MFFSNETRVSNTASPTSFVVTAQEPNVSQYGWTKADIAAYNQLIQYVDEVNKVKSYVSEVYSYVIDARRYVEDSMGRLDQFNLTYDTFKIEYQDFLTKWADAIELISYVGLAYSDILAKFGEIVNMYDQVLMSVIHIDERSTFVDQRAIDADNSATDANESYIKCLDLYTDLKEGQVYRGIWNPNDGTYPDHAGTNSVWDVVLNDGQYEVTFDGKIFRSGDRLLYIKASTEYQLLATGSGVTSVNGMNGAITITPATINAVSRAGDMMTGGLTAPTLNATGVASAQGLTFNGKTAIGGTNDTWLRLNPHSQFTSGVYVNGFARISNGVEVGTIGSTAAHTLKADGTWSHSGSGSIGGDITSNLNVLGNITEKGARVFSDNYVQPEIPFPDVWIPFNDGLQMLAGYGDEVKVDNWVVAKMATFSRASQATYIDKSGVLRTADIDEPRFEKEGLLIEGASTNLVINSETINFVPYGDVTSVEYDTSTLGDFRFVKQTATGSTTAGNNASANSNIGSLAVGDVLVFSAVFKMYEGQAGRFRLRIQDGSSFYADNSFYCDMREENISNCVHIKTQPFADKSLVKVEVRRTITTATTGTVAIQLQALAVAGISHVGCFQCEKLPFATSYIPTSGAAATRAADVVQIPYDKNCISDSGTISVEGYGRGAVAWGRELQIGMSGWALRLPNIASATPTVLGCEILATSSFRQGSALGISGDPANVYSAYTWDATGIKCLLNVDGAIKFTNKTGATPAIVKNTNGMINISPNTTNTRTGHIRNFRIWHKALSDTQLKAITS